MCCDDVYPIPNNLPLEVIFLSFSFDLPVGVISISLSGFSGTISGLVNAMQSVGEFVEVFEDGSSTRAPDDELVDKLPDDAWEEILARMPLSSVGTTSRVCKRWRRITNSPTFLALHSEKLDHPQIWLYINGSRYKITEELLEDSSNRSSALDQEPSSSSSSEITNPPPELDNVNSSDQGVESSCGPGGIFYVLSEQRRKLSYKIGALSRDYVETPELTHPRTLLPVIGVVKNSRTGAHKVLCVGTRGDQPKSVLRLEIFSSESNSWEESEELPSAFQGLSSTIQSVSLSVCDGKMYVFHIPSGTVAWYDVKNECWSEVKTLRPLDGVQHCYLGVGNGELLLIGGNDENESFVFRGWNIDEEPSPAAVSSGWSKHRVVVHVADSPLRFHPRGSRPVLS